jgi:hypothetical protein
MTDATPSDEATQSTKQSARTRRRRSQAAAAAKQVIVGYPARAPADPYRGRQLLNADTIREMHIAFNEGGREAIRKVMKNQPAIFLKLLVLLVPRELQIEHRGGVKGMTEEQIVDAIEAIEGFLARRRGDAAKVIEGVGQDVGTAVAVADSQMKSTKKEGQ